jgi:hypothetical protein
VKWEVPGVDCGRLDGEKIRQKKSASFSNFECYYSILIQKGLKGHPHVAHGLARARVGAVREAVKVPHAHAANVEILGDLKLDL